jgi:hypothetical protein
MIDKETREFIWEIVGRLSSEFGITGIAPGCGSKQPGAMEVLSDALLSNNFGKDCPGVASALVEIARSIDHLAESIDSVAEKLPD